MLGNFSQLSDSFSLSAAAVSLVSVVYVVASFWSA